MTGRIRVPADTIPAAASLGKSTVLHDSPVPLLEVHSLAGARREDRAGAVFRNVPWPVTCDPRPPRRRRLARIRPPPQAAALQARIYHHALAAGFSRGYLVSAGVLVLPMIIALFMMLVRRGPVRRGSGARADR